MDRISERVGLQEFPDLKERVIIWLAHEYPAERRNDKNFTPAAVTENAMASSWGCMGDVYGAQYPRFRRYPCDHLALVEGVIAQSHAVDSGVEQHSCMAGGNSAALSGILAVCNHKVQRKPFAESWKLADNCIAPRAADCVTQKQYSHGVNSFHICDAANKRRLLRLLACLAAGQILRWARAPSSGRHRQSR